MEQELGSMLRTVQHSLSQWLTRFIWRNGLSFHNNIAQSKLFHCSDKERRKWGGIINFRLILYKLSAMKKLTSLMHQYCQVPIKRKAEKRNVMGFKCNWMTSVSVSSLLTANADKERVTLFAVIKMPQIYRKNIVVKCKCESCPGP